MNTRIAKINVKQLRNIPLTDEEHIDMLIHDLQRAKTALKRKRNFDAGVVDNWLGCAESGMERLLKSWRR
jgi:hypothetical protein